jgi:hypothetical protein
LLKEWEMATVNEIWAAYEEAQGRWSGSDWPTHFGSLGLDLNGVSSRQAYRAVNRWRAIATAAPDESVSSDEGAALADMALHLRLRGAVASLSEGTWSRLGGPVPATHRTCAETLAQEWEVAARLLAEIEDDARWAEQEGWDAVRSAEAGDWRRALWHARRASLIESGYYALCLWGQFTRVIEMVAGQAGITGNPGDDLFSDLG